MQARGKPEKDKILALIYYLSGISMRATGKLLGVSTTSILRWIGSGYAKYAEKDRLSVANTVAEEIEIDELQHFLCKKNNFYGSGKYSIIELQNSSAGYVVIVAQRPLKNSQPK